MTGDSDSEYEKGECERCGHDREMTREIDGETVCLLCEEGISGGYEADA